MPLHLNTDGNQSLATQLSTLFVLTESGRIQRENDPERSAGPRLYIAGCQTANVVRFRHDVGAETAHAIEALVANEPPLADPDSTLRHLADYITLLNAEASVEQQSPGLVYRFPDHFSYEHDFTVVGSGTPNGDRWLGRLESEMPEPILKLGFRSVSDLWAPWSLAVHKGKIASICITARLGTNGAEAGLTTVPGFRGRGFGAAATAGWASLPSLRGRTLYYSMQRTNISSRRVAERLGLSFIGTSLRLT